MRLEAIYGSQMDRGTQSSNVESVEPGPHPRHQPKNPLARPATLFPLSFLSLARTHNPRPLLKMTISSKMPSSLNDLDDRRIQCVKPLISPQILMEDVPLTHNAWSTIKKHRDTIADILHERDDRLLVVVGPCSIHDPTAALEYASKLLERSIYHQKDLVVLMRVYFEKPRTTVGWKGLINVLLHLSSIIHFSSVGSKSGQFLPNQQRIAHGS